MPADTDAARDALRALEAMVRWEDSGGGRHVGIEADEVWIDVWATWPASSTTHSAFTLAAAILAAHAALVAYGELPPLPEAEAGDGGGANPMPEGNEDAGETRS